MDGGAPRAYLAPPRNANLLMARNFRRNSPASPLRWCRQCCDSEIPESTPISARLEPLRVTARPAPHEQCAAFRLQLTRLREKSFEVDPVFAKTISSLTAPRLQIRSM